MKKFVIGASLFLLISQNALFAKNILILGDSLSFGDFSSELKNQLELNKENRVFYYASSGGNPYYWLDSTGTRKVNQVWRQTGKSDRYYLFPSKKRPRDSSRNVPKLNELFLKHSPEIVIVQAGNNLFSTLKKHGPKTVHNRVAEMVERIVEQGKARCFWILPPTANTKVYSISRQNEMERTLQNATLERCRSFNSRSVTLSPQSKYNDGIHYSPKEYKSWAKEVANWIIPKLEKPALLAKPQVIRKSSIRKELTDLRKIRTPIKPAVILELELVSKPSLENLQSGFASYGNALVIYKYRNIHTSQFYYVEHFYLKNRKIKEALYYKVGERFEIMVGNLDESLSTLYSDSTIVDDFSAKIYMAKSVKRIN